MKKPLKPREHILTLSCPDRRGIVNAVSGLLADHDCNILDSAQFNDVATGMFFMRVHFADESAAGPDAQPGRNPGLHAKFESLGKEFAMGWNLHDASYKPRVLLLVSKIGHCLNDLLFRYTSGLIHAEIPAVVSNHEDFRALTESHNIAFHHLPVSAETRAAQERLLLQLIAEMQIDLVVLARYMQVLSPELCRALRGRAINIHHSFLPSFKGAHPYAQAHARGVKLIGATAHFVTDALDEGPIIEQDVIRVDHAMSSKEFTAMGRDVESVVLARSVNWFVQHRILLNRDKTIVFR
ncbi:MAG TPA: formyltetrahydrofolate deformylase [Xanthomonadaceae bacterium]|jgi:formyltetrahydrofolate deformylase|nr:formyltetrahydrofolate deformylase [Xanthomonadaceae bacterium]